MEGSDGEKDAVETRDWAELPRDVLLVVLRRLNMADIFFGAGHVCRSWRHETREEPELWGRIDMLHLGKPAPSCSNGSQLFALAHTALRRSAGQCEVFWAKGISEDNNILFSKGVRMPLLRSLRLIPCIMLNINDALEKYTLLEELELSHCSDISYWTCAVVAKACPYLKSLRLNKGPGHWIFVPKDQEAMEIARMNGLRSLQLVGNGLGNDGLAAILNGCVHLETLDICRCFSIMIDHDDMRTR